MLRLGLRVRRTLEDHSDRGARERERLALAIRANRKGELARHPRGGLSELISEALGLVVRQLVVIEDRMVRRILVSVSVVVALVVTMLVVVPAVRAVFVVMRHG